MKATTNVDAERALDRKLLMRNTQLLAQIAEAVRPKDDADAVALAKSSLSESEFQALVMARCNMSSLAEVVTAIETATGESLTPTQSIAEIAQLATEQVR